MSWLDDFARRRNAQNLSQATAAKHAAVIYADNRRQFRDLTPMVRRLLRDVGDIAIGRNWYGWPKYQLDVSPPTLTHQIGAWKLKAWGETDLEVLLICKLGCFAVRVPFYDFYKHTESVSEQSLQG